MTQTATTPAAGKNPAWVHLTPAGSFKGRDGRGPYILDAAAVIAAYGEWGADLPVDYEHQANHAADNGQPAPAAGWIKQLQTRADGLWGLVEWTAKARAMLDGKEYRYLSPVFTFNKATGHITALLGAGLTNNPNLRLASLHSANMGEGHAAADRPDLPALRIPRGYGVEACAFTLHTAAIALQRRRPELDYITAVKIAGNSGKP